MISAFYELVRYRNKALNYEVEIENKTRMLIAGSRSSGTNTLRRWFGSGAVIDDIHQSILDQKMNSIAMARFISSRTRDEIIDDTSVIYLFFERVIRDETAIPTDDVKDILKMLEDRRQGYIRNGTTIVSGLIGGVLGATLTFLLSSHATSPPVKSGQTASSHQPSSSMPVPSNP